MENSVETDDEGRVLLEKIKRHIGHMNVKVL